MTLMGEVLLPSRTRLAQVRHPETGKQVLMLQRWQGEHHSALSAVISKIRDEKESDTYKVYARTFLEFDRYAEQVHQVKWDSPPDIILMVFEAYMKSHGAVIKGKKTRKISARDDTAPTDDETPKSPLTLKAIHEAVRAVYREARELGLYKYPHPLDKVNAEALRSDARLRDIARAKAGGSKPGQPYRPYGDPGRIYLLIGTTWVPKHLYFGSNLKKMLEEAFSESGAPLRDQGVLALMSTGGVRLAEACATSLAGWAKGSTSNSPGGHLASALLGNKIWMRNKGDGSAETKLVEYPPATLALIRRYWAEERHRYDPQTPEYLKWLAGRQAYVEHTPELYLQFLAQKKLSTRVPVFLSRHGKGHALSTNAFRQTSWVRALKHKGLYLRPHQIRHWYVSHHLNWINETYMSEGKENHLLYRKARRALCKQMAWKNPDEMLTIYDQISSPPETMLQIMAAENAERRLMDFESKHHGLTLPKPAVDKRIIEDLKDGPDNDAVLRALLEDDRPLQVR